MAGRARRQAVPADQKKTSAPAKARRTSTHDAVLKASAVAAMRRARGHVAPAQGEGKLAAHAVHEPQPHDGEVGVGEQQGVPDPHGRRVDQPKRKGVAGQERQVHGAHGHHEGNEGAAAGEGVAQLAPRAAGPRAEPRRWTSDSALLAPEVARQLAAKLPPVGGEVGDHRGPISGLVLVERAHRLGGDARRDRARRYVLRDHAVGPHDAVGPDRDPGQDDALPCRSTQLSRTRMVPKRLPKAEPPSIRWRKTRLGPSWVTNTTPAATLTRDPISISHGSVPNCFTSLSRAASRADPGAQPPQVRHLVPAAEDEPHEGAPRGRDEPRQPGARPPESAWFQARAARERRRSGAGLASAWPHATWRASRWGGRLRGKVAGDDAVEDIGVRRAPGPSRKRSSARYEGLKASKENCEKTRSR